MSCPCKLTKCLKKWKKERNIQGIEDNEEDSEADYILTHCEIDNCHQIYWRGKNGATCDQCGLDVCEICQCENGEEDEDEDTWLCEYCVKINVILSNK